MRLMPDVRAFLLECWNVAGTEPFIYEEVDPLHKQWSAFKRAIADKWIESNSRQGHFNRLWKLTHRAIQQLGV